MATNAQFSRQFTLGLKQLAKLPVEKFEIAFRKIAIDLDSAIVLSTPVDTGRARGNWFTTLNKPSSAVSERKGAGPAISEITSTANSLKIGDAIWMSNNLPYINRLENGWSTQSPPKAMVAANVARFRSKYGGG